MCQHLVEYDSLHWRFDLKQMEANLNIVTKQIRNQDMRATAVMTQGSIDEASPIETAATSNFKPSPRAFIEDTEAGAGTPNDTITLDRGADTVTLMNNF